MSGRLFRSRHADVDVLAYPVVMTVAEKLGPFKVTPKPGQKACPSEVKRPYEHAVRGDRLEVPGSSR